MIQIKKLDQITPADAPSVGGKAYNCALLKQAGFLVPDGVSIITDSFESLPLSAELRSWIEQMPRGTLFAVRSSAIGEDSERHSFAGIHATRLNVSPDGISDAIQACWASLRLPQALAYRRALRLPTDNLEMSALVQVMIKPVVSGVGFTVNPVTGLDKEIVISASWGLGETVVNGYVDPDEFCVSKSDGSVLSSHIGSKQFCAVSVQGVSCLVEMDESKRTKPSLSDKQLRELAELLVQIERHYKVPLDVEWCHDGVNFWVIQSRPVTLPVNPSGSSIEWTRANICEILPDLASPQVLSWICSLVNRVGREYFGNMIAPETELGPLARVFYGRMYYNLSQFRHICRIIGNAPVSVLCAMGHDGDIKPEDKVAKRPKFKELIRVLPDILRHLRMQLTVDKQIHGHLALIQDKMIHHLARDPNTLPCAEIWSVIKSALDTAPENLQMTLVLGSVMVYDLLLQVICKRVGFPYERLVYSHLAIGEKSVSTQQAYDLLSMAHLACRDEHVRNYFIHYPDSFSGFREDLRGTAFLREFDAFLRRYGHRGTYESDWALPRYHEDPASLLFAIRAHVQAPEYSTLEAIEERQIREAREVWNGFVAKLNWWKRLTVLPLMQWLFRKMKQMYLWREHYRSEMMRCIAELRRWHLCLARRFTELGWIEKSEDYFFLRLDEIEESMTDTSRSGSFREIVARRKSDLNVWQHLKMPLLMSERELPTLVRCANATFPDTQVTILRGLCVSAGCVEGEVLVIREPKDFVRMRNGAILVTSAADPSWTPLFTLASGVILEIGGIISHAATVAREYGLPTVANLKNATKLLKDGDWIRLDATNGAVEIISRVIPWQQEEEGPGHIRGGRQREAPH